MEWVLEEGHFLVGRGRWARQLTVDPGGRVQDVHDEPLLYPGADRVGLAGGYAVPGLWDSHVHLDHMAEVETLLAVSPEDSLETMLAAIRDFAGQNSQEPWIRGSGWNQNRWAEEPHRKWLDRVTGSRPAAMWARDHHTLWLNTQALRALGLWDSHDEGFDRDAEGPTGLIHEEAAERAARGIPSREPNAGDLKTVAEKLLALGFVGVTAMERIRSEPLLAEWGESYGLRLQVFWIDADGRRAKPGEVRPDEPGWFRSLGVKLFSDGALGTRTAWVKTPYEDTGSRGIPRLHGAPLRARLGELADDGWAAAIHAIGDAAVADVWQALLEVPSRGQALSRIEHAQLLDPQDLAELSGEGLAASMQPYHLPGDVPALEKGLGARDTRAFPWNALRRAGFTVTFGSDAPIVTADPLPALAVAVGGVDDGQDAERVMDPLDALATYSRGAARADRRPGGLAASGHPADFTVFEEDPLRALAEGRRPGVRATVVGGRIRYWKD